MYSVIREKGNNILKCTEQYYANIVFNQAIKFYMFPKKYKSMSDEKLLTSEKYTTNAINNAQKIQIFSKMF